MMCIMSRYCIFSAAPWTNSTNLECGVVILLRSNDAGTPEHVQHPNVRNDELLDLPVVAGGPRLHRRVAVEQCSLELRGLGRVGHFDDFAGEHNLGAPRIFRIVALRSAVADFGFANGERNRRVLSNILLRGIHFANVEVGGAGGLGEGSVDEGLDIAECRAVEVDGDGGEDSVGCVMDHPPGCLFLLPEWRRSSTISIMIYLLRLRVAHEDSRRQLVRVGLLEARRWHSAGFAPGALRVLIARRLVGVFAVANIVQHEGRGKKHGKCGTEEEGLHRECAWGDT
mmetsp:Transcript_28941/g.50903  ORF Transcript_28941/g.50903 Transcript_28941/m.50903 type:complete len:284 (+) Transcript_28941:268-1119(+)